MSKLPPCPVDYPAICKRANDLLERLQSREKAMEIMLTWPDYLEYLGWRGLCDGIMCQEDFNFDDEDDDESNDCNPK